MTEISQPPHASEPDEPLPVKRGRGRPRMTEAEKDAAKARREAGKPKAKVVALSPAERFALLIEFQPKVEEAERAGAEAKDRLKAIKHRLKEAFGPGVDVRKELSRFQTLQKESGRSDLRAGLEMCIRIRQHSEDESQAAAQIGEDCHGKAGEKTDAIDWYGRGMQAFADGRKDLVADDVSEGQAEAFLEGYAHARLTHDAQAEATRRNGQAV